MAAGKKYWFAWGFLLGLVMFGITIGIIILRSGIWKVGIPAIIIGALAFGALSAYYKEMFWSTIFKK